MYSGPPFRFGRFVECVSINEEEMARGKCKPGLDFAIEYEHQTYGLRRGYGGI